MEGNSFSSKIFTIVNLVKFCPLTIKPKLNTCKLQNQNHSNLELHKLKMRALVFYDMAFNNARLSWLTEVHYGRNFQILSNHWEVFLSAKIWFKYNYKNVRLGLNIFYQMNGLVPGRLKKNQNWSSCFGAALGLRCTRKSAQPIWPRFSWFGPDWLC